MIKQKSEAITFLRHQLLQWKFNNDMQVQPQSTTNFQMEWIEQTEHSAYLRVYWVYGGRTHSLYGEARR
ncbi:hypothetical protein ACFP7A_13515 [Sporolactobacillus kofuensis]|uniref:Uncharacterized protein n=1 Tax=Sporolactobacillus kofuensis TaxID=269672 RepID=A0ABW1WGA1_9BACL|nr:hypothetical protein [Sporolactobacillus kofuensis]MCO7176519.1 hypothetical protein [Sporolactobacillus kofuensis]